VTADTQTESDLNALKLASSRCEGCRLSERRTTVVFGEGNPRASLMLIGEGPGETEDRTGRPFVGRAGQLLDKALSDNGLSREHVYIGNVVKCRACDWIDGRAVNRAPSEPEITACRQWLLPQVRAIGPRVILCVGGPSASSLIHAGFRITSERGRYYPCAYARCAIATLHPAYVLRQQSKTHDGGYSLIVADVAKAWAAAQRIAQLESAGELRPFIFGRPASGAMIGSPIEAASRKSSLPETQAALFD
jgi:uracil-DNA glycosylase family 4